MFLQRPAEMVRADQRQLWRHLISHSTTRLPRGQCVSDGNTINSILQYTTCRWSVYIIVFKFYRAGRTTFPHSNQDIQMYCGLGNVLLNVNMKMCVVLFSEWCSFVVFFNRLLTASQPCCRVLKAACEWQKSLAASSTSPKRRCFDKHLSDSSHWLIKGIIYIYILFS